LGIVSYEWDFGDGTTGNGIVTSHTYTEPGTYKAMLTVKDEAGNSDTDSITVNVEAVPIAFPWWIVGVVVAVVVSAAALALWRRRGGRSGLNHLFLLGSSHTKYIEKYIRITKSEFFGRLNYYSFIISIPGSDTYHPQLLIDIWLDRFAHFSEFFW